MTCFKKDMNYIFVPDIIKLILITALIKEDGLVSEFLVFGPHSVRSNEICLRSTIKIFFWFDETQPLRLLEHNFE